VTDQAAVPTTPDGKLLPLISAPPPLPSSPPASPVVTNPETIRVRFETTVLGQCVGDVVELVKTLEVEALIEAGYLVHLIEAVE
jgi:hypothetical protein